MSINELPLSNIRHGTLLYTEEEPFVTSAGLFYF